MPRLGLWEILIIAFVLMVFFGANRIPDMMRGLARGLRGFKEELKAEEKPDAEAGEKPKTLTFSKDETWPKIKQVKSR